MFIVRRRIRFCELLWERNVIAILHVVELSVGNHVAAKGAWNLFWTIGSINIWLLTERRHS